MEKLETWRNLLKNMPKDNLNSLADMSQMWSSCAVGEKLGFPCNTRHELEVLLERNDTVLEELGSNFYCAIASNRKSEAMSILRKIEKHEVNHKVIEGIGDPLS